MYAKLNFPKFLKKIFSTNPKYAKQMFYNLHLKPLTTTQNMQNQILIKFNKNIYTLVTQRHKKISKQFPNYSDKYKLEYICTCIIQ
jgi:hypothetical protein